MLFFRRLVLEFVLKKFKSEIEVTRLANVHYFEFNENFNTKGDSHDFCELVYVDKGRIDIVSEHYTGELLENCMILHNAGETHSLICKENVAPNVIIIGFECKNRELDLLTHTPLILNDELQKSLAEIIKEARAVYLPPYDIPNQADMKKRDSFAFGADQLIKDYLQIFLIKALRATSATEVLENAESASGVQRISEAKKYLDENFTERIGIEELCFLFNTNRSTLTAGFKKVYGRTIIDYVNTLRIEYTKALLHKGHSLTEISEIMNLSSVHYLTSLFKKHTGMSPTEYIGIAQRQSVKK